MTIKVHGGIFSTATLRVRVCLTEKSLDYEFIPVDLRSGDHKKEPFISLNPFGQIPAFEDGDLNLFESRAITRYIARAYAGEGTPLVSSDVKKAAVAEVWAEVEAQRYEPPAAKLTWELGIKPILGMPTDDDVVKAQEAELAKVLDVYEARLAHSKYLGGDAFTLADLHHLPTLKYLMATPVKAIFDARPHVAAWAADITARPSWQKVLADCGLN
ncbi:glutathione S-transferase APIC-like [Salvia miltiorrhiza]|uniref:glutathione S-transferase APIC-like n=1 Tax=Salvia miltiorrhiza TaxID=226208 RepID=UPI0025AD390E|nr:glutathione S-transferase APIC-like [Salvia miltiorrhiza]